jgi:hypothetical protein
MREVRGEWSRGVVEGCSWRWAERGWGWRGGAGRVRCAQQGGLGGRAAVSPVERWSGGLQSTTSARLRGPVSMGGAESSVRG